MTDEEFERVRAAAAEAQFRRLFKLHAALLAAAKIGLDALSAFDASDLEMTDALVTSMQNAICVLQDAIAAAEDAP
jgi:hypothetical protein